MLNVGICVELLEVEDVTTAVVVLRRVELREVWIVDDVLTAAGVSIDVPAEDRISVATVVSIDELAVVVTSGILVLPFAGTVVEATVVVPLAEKLGDEAVVVLSVLLLSVVAEEVVTAFVDITVDDITVLVAVDDDSTVELGDTAPVVDVIDIVVVSDVTEALVVGMLSSRLQLPVHTNSFSAL